MPTPNEHHSHVQQPHEHESKDKAESVKEGYEVTDVSVQGIAVFLVALFVSVGIFFIFCFGMGKVINNALIKRDGPLNKWNAGTPAQAGKLKNMESNPAEVQQELHQLAQNFPTPRLQADSGDGAQDLVNLNQRENLLLGHYSWVDQSKGTVRIPIERAMELIAQRGLPVAPAQQNQAPLLFGDSTPVVTLPLTNGYAPTGFEQQEESRTKQPGDQASSKADNN